MNSTKYNVISNTTPIIALASIEKLELLPLIFNEITIAKAVRDEINAGGRIKVPSLETIEWIKNRGTKIGGRCVKMIKCRGNGARRKKFKSGSVCGGCRVTGIPTATKKSQTLRNRDRGQRKGESIY